jgi:hypothetical protein
VQLNTTLPLTLKRLNPERRKTALLQARNALIQIELGVRPSREQFQRETISEHPEWVKNLIAGLCLIVLTGTFYISASRLYVIGRGIYVETTSPIAILSIGAGIAFVLMGEFGQVVFSLAKAVLRQSRLASAFLILGIVLSTGFTITANLQVAKPWQHQQEFGWVAWPEALGPPILVLLISYVLKEQLLGAVQQHYTAEHRYQQSLAEWEQSSAQPELHHRWKHYYYSALWDQIQKANSTRTAKEVLMQLPQRQIRLLVEETAQQEDDWLADWSPMDDLPPLSVNQPQLTEDIVVSGNGLHHAEPA